MYLCIYVCYMYLCICMYACAHAHVGWGYSYVHMHVCICMYCEIIHDTMNCRHSCVYPCMYLYMYYAYACLHVHMHIYMHKWAVSTYAYTIHDTHVCQGCTMKFLEPMPVFFICMYVCMYVIHAWMGRDFSYVYIYASCMYLHIHTVAQQDIFRLDVCVFARLLFEIYMKKSSSVQVFSEQSLCTCVYTSIPSYIRKSELFPSTFLPVCYFFLLRACFSFLVFLLVLCRQSS